MKSTVKYEGTQEQKDSEALMDIQKYLGLVRYDILVNAAKTTPIAKLSQMLGFAGVEGYPVHAFLRTYRPVEYNIMQMEG
jgi:hypothetical protein